MKALVVHDSSYGNTETLARAIGEAVGEGATVMPAAQSDPFGVRATGSIDCGLPHAGRKADGFSN